MRPLPLEQRQLTGEDSTRNAHRIATTESRWRRQLDQAVALAGADLGDNTISDACRSGAIHDHADGSRIWSWLTIKPDNSLTRARWSSVGLNGGWPFRFGLLL
jgi:hypothetical protein